MKKRLCKVCKKPIDHNNPLISKCKECTYKKSLSNKKQTRIKPISDKRKKRLKNWWSEKELFKEIWEERPHICVDCWKVLKEAKAHNFAHIKSKWKYPELRLDKNNIQIKCFRCHFKQDHWMDYKWPDLD